MKLEIERVVEAGKKLTSSLQPDQVVQILKEQVNEIVCPRIWCLWLTDDNDEELHCEAVIGGDVSAIKDLRIKMGEGVAGFVAQSRTSIVIPDSAKDTRFFGRQDKFPEWEAQSVVAVPLCFDGKCLGVIELLDRAGAGDFQEADLSLFESLSHFAAIALGNARRTQGLYKLTITDDLTGLHNARHLSVMLETEIYRSQRYGYLFSMVFLDLDAFKDLEESHGWDVADHLVVEVGQALKSHCRLIDFAYHYGREEFVLVLPQTSREEACVIARRLHKLIRETVWLVQDGLNLRTSASLGLVTYPVDGQTQVELLNGADTAINLVKNSSGDGVAVANVGILNLSE